AWQDSVISLNASFSDDLEGITYVYDYGFEYSTTSADLSEGVTQVHSNNLHYEASAGFSYPLANIPEGTTVYFRAYATTVDGTEYGEIMSVKALGAPAVVAKYPMWRTDNDATIDLDITLNEGEYDDFYQFENRNVYYGTERNRLILSEYIDYESDYHHFSVNLHDLAAETKYYYVAEVTNDYGTTRSDTLEFITCGTMTDSRDNTQYYTIQIGNQTWMAQNLKFDGVTAGTDTSSFVAYRYNPDDFDGYVEDYGYLYNWTAILNGGNSSTENPSGVQGICPNGWHLPSDAEWTQLTEYLGGGDEVAAMLSGHPASEGQYWEITDMTESVNFGKSGFNAMPTGVYYAGYYEFGKQTAFWSVTESDDIHIYSRYIMGYGEGSISRSENEGPNGYAVRCIKGTAVYAYDTINPCMEQPYSYTYHDTVITTDGDYTIREQIDSDTENIYKLHIAFHPTLTATINDFSNGCFGANNGYVEVGATGGAGDYSYAWSTPEMQTTARLSNLTDGGYSVTVTDVTGCTASVSQTIVTPGQLTVTISGDNQICEGDNASLTATAEGGTPDYSYAWTNGATNESTNVQTAGTYAVTVTDDASCTATAAIVVTVNPAATLELTSGQQNQTLCYGTNFTTTVFTYGGGANGVDVTGLPNGVSFTTDATNHTVEISGTPTEAGSYTYMVTTTGATSPCTNMTITGTIIVQMQLTATISGNNPDCYGDETTLTASLAEGTPNTYAWSSGETSASITVSPTTTTTYTVTITDANNCTATALKNIVVNSQLTVSISGDTQVQCFGDNTATLTASASGGSMATGYTYNWSNSLEGQTISTLGAGNYIVTVTDANLCTAEAEVEITEPTAITISVVSTSPQICTTLGSIEVSATGGTGALSFAWSTTAHEATYSGLTAGFYTVTVTDENNCTATRIVEVEDHSVIPDVDITNNTGATVITCAVTEISLTAEGNGDFVWDDGSTEAGRTVSTLGTYSVTITDANGCANSTSIDIDQSNENPTVVLADDDITICAGTSTTVEVASVTGGVAPYQYSWNGGTYGGDTEYTASNVTANTTITLTVKDANGCTGTASAEISLNDRPTAVISGGEAICNGDEATFTIAFTGAPTYNYTWSDGTDTHNGSTNESSVTINVTPTATTTYTLVSLSDDNCTSTGGDLTGSVEVIVNEIPYATAVTTDNEMCAAPFSGIITVSTFGPEDTDYTVTLVGNSSQTVSQDGTAVFTSLEAGDYTVEVSYTMNSHTCTETYPVTIGDELTYPTVEVTAYNNGCSGENNGTIEIHADGGTPDYTYAWTNADDNPVSCDANGNLSELSTGTYTVTVTDAHGCATSTSQTITSPATALSASISGPTEVCNNTTATLTVNADGGTAPYTYAWDDDNTNPTTAESITTPVLTSDNTPFTYTVTVTDVNGCTFEASHTVTIGDTPSLTLDSNAPICDGEELNLSAMVTNAGDSYTIEWTSASTDAGLPNPANTDQIIVTPASPGTYTYTATLTTDVCEAGTDYLVSDDITITVYPKPEVAITTTSQQICPNATIDLDAELTENGTAEYTYTWSATDGITLAETDDITTSETTTTNTATAPAANIATCGTQYIISLHVEDTNGCTADASPITITVGDEINPTIGDDNLNRQLTSTNCTFIVPDLTGEVRNIASDNCTANGNLTVSQNITAGTEITTATTVVVTVTDQCGNNSTKEIELTLPEELTTSLSSNPATIACNGGTTSITNTPDGGAAPYLYFWSNSTNEQNLADVSAGTYTVTVRDNNGCSVVESIEITQPNALTASLSATEIPCHGVTSTITNTVGGGTTPYAYAWETGETSQNLTGVSGGTYSVTVTDANGCTASATITIIEPAELTSSLSAGEIGCNGGIANITNTVNGGTEPITYEWSNGNNTQGLTGVGAGEYTVTVRDNNGCSVVQSATISQPDALTASLTAGTINCNGETTDITSAVNGGTQNYSYAWSNGETTNNLTGVGAGNYSVTVSDANSCTASAITTVSAPDVLTVSISGSTSVCENTTSTLTANVQGGTTDYTYLWSYNNSTTVSITTPQLTTATEYSVTVTDANNCSATAGVTVVIGDTPGISIAEVQAICVGGNTILQANIYNAGDNYTVEWTSTDANAGLPADVTTDAITVTPTTAGAYTYTASLTATSCSDGQPFTSSEDVTLTVNALPDAAITNNTNETTITCNTTQISLTATGGNTYAWSNGVANADNNIATADTYIVTVTDVNGCSNTASETISEDVTAPIVSIANNTGTTLLTCTTTTINVEATGDDATYLWSNGETTATTAITTGGTYTVTATADNGCTSTAAIEITPNADAPTVSITNNSDTTVLTCSLTSINVTATGSGTSYEWSNGANTAENTLTAPGTYTVTATAGNGCSASDQITITQNIEAPEIIASAAATAICQGGSTTISATGGQSYTWSPETELQTTVGSSITVTPTETRTYTVTGVGTNGCTGTAEVTVTVNMPTSSAFTETACDSYDWNSTTYTESGDYVQTLQTVNGCDSVVTLHLTIYNSQTEFVEVTACDSYEWAGETYTVSGNYEHTFTAVNGCDSVVTLRLTINNSQTNMVEVTACESYEWNSNIYTETGDYEQTFQTTEGCDSVVTLHLTISSTITNEISDTACDSFQWNDTTYYASGEYIQTFYTREGCDSVVTLNLTINYSTEITDTVVVCDSFEWEGQTYTESGEYEKAYTTINGCDSIRRLHLTINQSLTESVEVTACESYQWNDSIYYASGDYEQTFQSVSGCDSVVTLHLTINSSTTNEISAQMCSGVPYTYEGETFTEAGTYTVTLTNSVGCDSIVTLTITYASNCGGIVSGIITDENSGEPIYNARVTVGNKVTRTNAEGEYSIEVLRGRKTFRVSANGYISHSRSVDIQSDTVFNISLNAPHIETDVDSLTVSSYPYLEQSDSITLSNTGSGTLVWSSITEYDNLALVEDSVIQQRRNTRSLWDSIQTFATRENAEQAIATDGFFIYTSSWMRPGEFNRYTPNGEYVETFYVENVGSIRNLSYDGTHFYGTEGTNIIFKLDLDNQTLVDSIETDIQEIRHCSFNKQDGSLLAGSWNSLYRIDIENGTSEPIRNDLANVYSSAFDNLSPGGPYLWLFSQTSQNNGPSAYIRQFNISTGEYTDRTHYLDDINLSSSSLAGGICASEYVCEGKFVLLADVQNPMGSNTIATYEIGRTNNVVRTGKKSGSIAPNSSENISVKASATETGDYSATIKYRAAVMGTYSRDIDVNISAVAPECDAVQQISIVTDTFHTVTLDWQPVELGNYESVSYLVFNTASQYAIDTVSGTTVTYDGLPVGEHCFSVRALSQAGYTCLSAASDTVCAEIQDIPCNVPLAVEARSDGESITISWNMPVGVDYVSLYRNSDPIDEHLTTTSYIDTNVVPETDYCYIVIAHFENGVCDEISGNACIRIASDVCTEAPVLTADAVNGTVALEWTESNGAVNYRVFRNDTFIGATNGNTYIDNVTESDEYCYRVESICEYGMFASSDEVCISVDTTEDDGSGSGEGSGEGEGDAIDEWTADNLTLYPNPTYGQFFIEGQRIAVVQIFNASGMLVTEIENTEDERITINCEGWNPGLYNIRIISTEGETATRKVTIFR
ncbi:MAG: carboxypeptidase-like regulatory domain-containing protein, partial [Bacteroidales bacterium]|nr:carboxypeptidase-like regulatory domain-containing protein [Bacteroidales bacterium]